MDEQEMRNVLSAAVAQAREHWLIQQVWFLTPWGQWRRGAVEYIGETGAMLVLVDKHGRPCRMAGLLLHRMPAFFTWVSRKPAGGVLHFRARPERSGSSIYCLS